MNPSKEERNTHRHMLGFASRMIGRFLVFLLVLFGIGVLLHSRMNAALNHEVEKFVSRQAELTGLAYHGVFLGEEGQLERLAGLLGAGHLSPEHTVAAAVQGESYAKAGLVDMNGTLVTGSPLPQDEKLAIQRVISLQGHASIRYYEQAGIVVMVPVQGPQGNSRYVLYKIYSEEGLREEGFHLTDKKTDTKVLLYDLDKQRVVVPFAGYGEGDRFYDAAKQAPKGIDEMLDSLENSHDVAIFDPSLDEDYVMFASVVPETAFVAVGYTEWRSVISGIINIHMIVLWVFGLLVVLFCVFVLYAFANQVEAEESRELREARDEALKANQAKSEFLANMSHEIRTPLNAVLGMNEMILREGKEPSLRKYAWNVKSAGETLLAIINDILDFSKIESGKLEIVAVQYDFGSVLNDIFNMVNYKASQKGLAFRMDIMPELPCSLVGDEVRLRQVVVNILNNAVKYTHEGQVTLRIWSEQQIFNPQQEFQLCFEVTDTGIGIKDEDKGKLFSQFQRLDIEKNRNIEGTGLGLSITGRLVQMMGGTIEVESKYGEGSTFTIRVPQKVDKPEPIGDFRARIEEYLKQKELYQESFVAPEAKILVVDDNDMNLYVVESLLKQTEIQVTLCTSGRECLQRLEQEHYDIVFLDHMMPDMDGLETLARAKKLEHSRCKGTPMIALTANAISGVKEMFLAKGFDDYLSKPVDSRALEQMLRKYLPKEKVQAAPLREDAVVSGGAEEPAVQEVQTEAAEAPSKAGGADATKEAAAAGAATAWPGAGQLIDQSVGLRYCGGSEEMHLRFLTMFCKKYPSVEEKLAKAYEEGNWEDYTVFVHAVKSTSMSIGGVQLSELAKSLEMAGHAWQDGPEEEKEAQLEFIRAHHGEVLELYRQLVAEAGERFGAEV